MLFYGSGGTLLPPADHTVTGSAGQGHVSRPVSIMTKHGAATITASQRFSIGAMARGAARFAGPLGVGLSIASPFIYDWFTDSGIMIDSTGTAVAVAPGQFQSTGSYLRTNSGPAIFGWSVQEVCSRWAAQGDANGTYTLETVSGNYCGGTVYFTGGSAPRAVYVVGADYDTPPYLCPAGNFSTGTACLSSPSIEPLTPSQVEAQLLANARTIAEIEKIISEGIKQPGFDPDEADKPTATPGADSPVTRKTETTTLPDGTVETTTRDCKASPKAVPGQPSSVKLVEECTVTKTSTPPSGSPTTTTTTTSDEGTSGVSPAEQVGLCDGLLGKLLCTDLGDPLQDEIPRSERSLDFEPEVLFGSGVCPPDKVLNVHGMTLQLTNMAQTCDWLSTLVKPIALLLATFTATLIVIGGPKQ